MSVMLIPANMEESVLKRGLANTPASVPLDLQATTVRLTLTIASTPLVAIKELALTKWMTLSAPASPPSLERPAKLSLILAQSDRVSMAEPAHLMATSTSSPAPVHLATRVLAVSWTSTNVQEPTLVGTMGLA